MASGGDEIILTLRINRIDRGEFTLLQTADGDFWIAAHDLPRLGVAPAPAARREARGQAWYSMRALGATGVNFDMAELRLAADFPATLFEGSAFDLSNRPAPLPPLRPAPSAILNYRASAARAGSGGALQLRLATELNLRVGEVLLRQEARWRGGGPVDRGFARGATQLIWDDRLAGRRVLAGDQVVAGSPSGSVFTGVGLSLTRVFGMTPEVIRQPTAAVRVNAATPSEVEVSVDGSTVFRTRVPPGPVSLQNLAYYGGARTVRVTVTDAAGRRQVVEQPYLFTDSVLAQGLHEYSYFAGRRSELGPDDRWRYREAAWQAWHRYGFSDGLTLQASGEGSADFSNGGVGATWRDDLLGLVSADLLASRDHRSGERASGWAARYSYVAPTLSFYAGHRKMGASFRSFAGQLGGATLLSETRFGAATRVGPALYVSGDVVRGHDMAGRRDSYAARVSTSLGARTSLQAEILNGRLGAIRDWAVNVYLRFDLGGQEWAGTTWRAVDGSRSIDVEAGRQLLEAEGLGYRVGTTAVTGGAEDALLAFGNATWNWRHAALDLSAVSHLKGSGADYLEAGVSGAIVGLPGYIGSSRHVGDSFALARLGVAHAGVDVFLNNQLQGRTDAAGELLVPQVGAFGRQDLSIDDKQLPMEYNIARRRVTIAPPYKSGTLVEFGARKLRAVTGLAWVQEGGKRTPLAARSWVLRGAAGELRIETAPSGDFYLEDGPPGLYAGQLADDTRTYACTLRIPAFEEAVHELEEGIVCE